MWQSRVLFYRCVLLIVVAWPPCYADDSLTGAKAKWDNVEKGTEAAFAKYQDAQNKSWEEMHRRVLKKWADGALPQQKTYIEYFDQDTTRVKVDYENGAVTVEALLDSKDIASTSQAARDKINKALSAVVTTDSKSTNAVLSADEITAEE